jgi:hypothetical protein
MSLIYYTTERECVRIPAKKIICRDKQTNIVATVLDNSNVLFEKTSLSIAEINEIIVIANNFDLLYDNKK